MTKVEIQQPVAIGSSRLASVDVVRGITIAFMILVNYSGWLGYAYWPLKHAAWNGWTPTDLVFPTFLFIVGITIVLSTDSRRARGASRKTLMLHILRRAIILFLLGLVVNGFPFPWLNGFPAGAPGPDHLWFRPYPAHRVEIYGVLQRIAICYLFAAILYLCSRRVAVLIGVTVAALFGYWILMRFVPVPGYGTPTHAIPLLDNNFNWDRYLDRKIFPWQPYGPEGLTSDIPALATTLLGILTGLWLKTKHSQIRIAAGLFTGAIGGLALGKVWNIWFPINKHLWTSSYVLFAAGWTLLALSIFYFIIEIKQWKHGWIYTWVVFGSNAILIYAFSELLVSTLVSIYVPYSGHPRRLMEVIYEKYFYSLVTPSFGWLLNSLVFVLICMLPAVVLYHKKIFIKI